MPLPGSEAKNKRLKEAIGQTMNMRSTKIRAVALNLVLVTVSVFAALLLFELYLALFNPSKVVARPFFHIQSFFCQYDPVLGWENKPNYSGIVRIDTQTAFHVTHNAQGLRDKDHPYEKPTGVTRILALGDSFVWGFGVAQDELFSEIIERDNPRIEVINMGVSGYGTDQQFLTYTEEGYKYHPDLVVLAFYANDYTEIATSLSYGYPKPCATIDDGNLTFWNVPVPRTAETERKMYGNPETMFGRVKKFLRRHTHTYPFIAARLNSIPALRRVIVASGLGDEYGRSLQGLGMMQHQDAGKISALLERLLADLKRETAKRGTALLLVNIPIKENAANGRVSYSSTLPDAVSQNDTISAELGEISRRNNINFVNLLGAVRAKQEGGGKCYNSSALDIHFNREGQLLLARAITDWLQRNPKTP